MGGKNYKTLEIELPYDLPIPVLNIYPKELKSECGRDSCPLMFYKKGNPAICDNMDEPWGHLAKWNKAITEGQTLQDST